MKTKRSRENQKKPARDKSNLLLVAGFVLVGIAIALFLFGDELGGDGGSEFDQIPTFNRQTEVGDAQIDGGELAIGAPAIDFAAQNLEGEWVQLSELRGQPVMINFWATWCPPCRLEMPDFQEAYDAHRDNGLVILAVNQGESEGTVRQFFYDEQDFTYTPLLDKNSEISQGYGIFSFPTTVFVDEAGVVTAVHRGLLPAAQLNAYLADLMPDAG
jgi:thiol-disulfide isomerase/thioredoxin